MLPLLPVGVSCLTSPQVRHALACRCPMSHPVCRRHLQHDVPVHVSRHATLRKVRPVIHSQTFAAGAMLMMKHRAAALVCRLKLTNGIVT